MAAKKSPRTEREPEELLKHIHALAKRVYLLKPWEWFPKWGFFAIRAKTWKKSAFVILNYASDTGLFGIHFLWGERAFVDYLRPATVPFWYLEIPMLSLTYVSFPSKLPVARTALATGKPFNGVLPVLHSIKVGYKPWFPDYDEIGRVEALLEQTLGILLQAEEIPEAVRIIDGKKMLISRQTEDGEWSYGNLILKQPDDTEPPVLFSERFKELFSNLPMVETEVQVDFRFIPTLSLEEGDMEGIDLFASDTKRLRPKAMLAIFLVENGTGRLFTSSPLSATPGSYERVWEEFPEKFLSLLLQFGGCPARINVTGERMISWIRAMEIYRPFKLVMRGELDLVDKAEGKLVEWIQKEKSKFNGQEEKKDETQ